MGRTQFYRLVAWPASANEHVRDVWYVLCTVVLESTRVHVRVLYSSTCTTYEILQYMRQWLAATLYSSTNGRAFFPLPRCDEKTVVASPVWVVVAPMQAIMGARRSLRRATLVIA